MTEELIYFLTGVTCLASAAIGGFFWRFWARTRDPLFRVFAVAFWLMALGWLVGIFVHEPGEASYLVYVPRLLAFCCLIWGIIGKNRGRPGP